MYRMSDLRSGDINLKLLNGVENMQRINSYLQESVSAKPNKKSIEKIMEIRSVRI